MELSPDERRLLTDAREFQDLSRFPAWKRLLDALAEWSDEALAEMRSSATPSTDLISKWREREACLLFIQNLVLGTVERRDNFIREVLTQHGLQEPQIEQFVKSFYGDTLGEIHA